MTHILMHKSIIPRIDQTAFIAPSAVVIGDVHIGAESSIWFNVTIRGDVHEIRIGCRSNIQDNSVVHVTSGKSGTYIGDDVTIGHGAVIHACTIESGAFVGMGSIILDGAVVESGAMVAAGALITPGKRVRQGELWAGNPASLLRRLSEKESAHFAMSATHYAELAALYRKELA